MNSSQNNSCMHNCQEIAQKIMLVIDGEISCEQKDQLITEIEQCPQCLQHFNIEKSFKEFICSKLCRKNIDPGLIHSIKEKIQKIIFLLF